MKKLLKIFIPVLFALTLLLAATPVQLSADPVCSFQVAGDEEDIIELITLLRV